MATRILLGGFRDWRMTRDDGGHREYKLTIQVEADATDGPARVLQTAGLPLPGTPWLVRGDVDLWAWCRANVTVKPRINDGEKTRIWDTEFTFSTKPPTPSNNRCHDLQIEDPLLEPQKVSGRGSNFQKEATHDRFGSPILTSSHEVIRGPQVEFDDNRPSIRIEQNVLLLRLDLLSQMVNTINTTPLWGLPALTIKFSNYEWERKFHGLCKIYYTRILEFDIRYEGWDRDLLDEGTKVLKGHWGDGGSEGSGWVLDKIDGNDPDSANPAHFIRFTDRNGNPARVILDGFGKPYDNTLGTGNNPGQVHVEYYHESNFLLLGVPLQF